MSSTSHKMALAALQGLSSHQSKIETLSNLALTPKAPRMFLGRNCEKLPLWGAVRKKLLKKLLFNIQPYKFVLDYYGNVWKKLQNFRPHGLKDYNV